MTADRAAKVAAYRMSIAVHEVGHRVVWSLITGARVKKVTLTGSGWSLSGLCLMDWSKSAKDDDSQRLYLAGLLAGAEAQRLYCKRTGTRLDQGGWSADLAVFRRVRRQHEPSRQWSESALRADARRLVTAHWNQIERLAGDLARKGRL